jgi:GNAT superfamily N-acetyltransferase
MMVTIIPYEEKYQADFKRLNLEWLDQYGLTESHDLMVLNDPTGTILDNGGFIWLAKEQDEIVGTIGLINEGNGVFELAKMTVAKNWQGKGISRQLMETCLNKAREVGAIKISLFSNSQLQVALKLYEKYGFRHVEVVDNPFLTADVKMELSL